MTTIQKTFSLKAIYIFPIIIYMSSGSYAHENIDDLVHTLKKITAVQAGQEKQRDLEMRTIIDSGVSPANQRNGAEVSLTLETYDFAGKVARPFDLYPDIRNRIKFGVLIMRDGEVGQCGLAQDENPIPATFLKRICSLVKKMYFGKKNTQIGDTLLPLVIQRPAEDAPSAK
jgi:hypothetical protein